jgi:hypothetical protein
MVLSTLSLNRYRCPQRKAAETIVYLASSDEVDKVSGKYFIKKNKFHPHKPHTLNWPERKPGHFAKNKPGFAYEIKEKEVEKKEELPENKATAKSDDKPGGA